ncbi:MAG: hypothetical protein KAW49_03965, partial [Anaerolineae bacterium]|nr:hypothetical protein [Anaerolineae bacterium]
MRSKKWFALVSLIVVAGMLITACQPEAVVETVVVTQVVEVEGERVVEEVVVTATPAPEPTEVPLAVIAPEF